MFIHILSKIQQLLLKLEFCNTLLQIEVIVILRPINNLIGLPSYSSCIDTLYFRLGCFDIPVLNQLFFLYS